jgi:lipopolysaccharide assembly outer membrane protein LptD (OstA)
VEPDDVRPQSETRNPPDAARARRVSARAGVRTLAGWCALLTCVALLPVFGAAQEEEGGPRYTLTGKQMRIDPVRNVLTLTDSVRLEYGTATVVSDRAVSHGSGGKEHVYFYDNVRIIDRAVEMTGDVGEFVRELNYAELRQNVVIRDSTGIIRAQRARYYRNDRTLWLWGDVDFQDPKTRVQADSVHYLETEAVGEAFGHVVITDIESGSIARGPHAIYDRDTGQAQLLRESTLTLRDDAGRPTEVFADSVGYDTERNVVRAYGDVRILHGNTEALADSALLFQDSNHLELRGRPSVRQGNSRITGTEIDVDYGGGQVEQVVVRRNARLVQTRADTLLVADPNVVQGNAAVMQFESGQLRRAVVSGRGSSTFVPATDRPDRLTLNEATADSIVILFEQDDVEEVLFIGNASGTYRFYEGNVDSLRQRRPAEVDSVFGVVVADTTAFDFRSEAQVVEYSGERILYLTPINDLHISGSAEVFYEKRTLRAGRITFDADTDELTARENPILIEGTDRLYGTEMGYDMESRNAYVDAGETEFDQGYYRGERIVRQPDGSLRVGDARYTSCDLAGPHYNFKSKEMKIELRDMVVGRPVVLHLGNVPILYLPFFFNSVNEGRRSGFIQPRVDFGLGSNSRFIRGLDYYWAASQYWDVLFSSSYTERNRVDRSSVQAVLANLQGTRNIQLSGNLRYKVRYNMEGNLQYSRSDDIDSDASFVTWRGSHRQTIGQSMTLNGTLDFASNDLAVRVNNRNTDFERARQRQLTSSLTFTRRGGLATTTMSLQRRQIITPDESFINRSILNQTLPSFSVRFRSIRLAPRPRDPRNAPWIQKFLSELQFSPNLNFRHTMDDVLRKLEIGVGSSGDIPGLGDAGRADTLDVGSELPSTNRNPTILFEETLRRYEASTSVALARQGTVGFVSVTPSVSYSESYVDDDRNPLAFGDRFTRSVRASIATQTRFFGFFYPKLGSLTALRHTIEPRATWSWTAAPGRRPRQSVALSLSNRIDMKYRDEEEERRRDGLLDWALSTSYDPDRTALIDGQTVGREWADIASTLTLNRQGPFRVTMTQVFDPYSGKIVSTSIPLTLRFSGRFPDFAAAEEDAPQNRVVREEGEPEAPADSLRLEDQWGFQPRAEDPLREIDPMTRAGPGGELGWDVGLSYSFRRAQGRTIPSSVGVSAGIRPTRNWTVRYRASFDTRTNKMTNPGISIERDLHCWTASFARVFDAFEDEWRYYFRIYVKRHQDELFLESGDRSYGL